MGQTNFTYLNTTSDLENQVNQFIKEWFSDTKFMTVRTSGSTGTPKEIILEKEKMKLSAKMTGDFLGIQYGEKALLCLSVDTIAGKMMLIRALELGLALTITQPSSNPLLLCEKPIDFIAIVPLQLSAILKESAEQLKKIRHCIVGGGILSKDQEEALTEHNITVYQTFGMTETISHVAMRKIGKLSEQNYSATGDNRFSQTENQCLIIHSPLLSTPLITNDQVELINEKEFRWIGRMDFVINSGGVKIHPEEVEKKIKHFIPFEFFIGSLPDPLLGQKVVLFAETSSPLTLSKKKLLSALNKYEVPKEIYCIPSFQRTESGKINRVATSKLSNVIQQVL